MMKILYVDIPFALARGGDKNRSRFLWDVISSNFDADLLLLAGTEEKSTTGHSGYKNIHTLEFSKGKLMSPDSIYSFSAEMLNKFKTIVSGGSYSAIVFRFLSTSKLAEIAQKADTSVKIIIDVDMLFSRIAAMSWNKEKSIRNRFYFFEKMKLDCFEKKIFTKPYTFLFTNGIERDFVVKNYPLKRSAGRFKILPNVMIGKNSDENKKPENSILFFGTLNSAANEDAFHYLVEEIYPKIEPVLKKHDIKIRVAGKNQTPLYKMLIEKHKAGLIVLDGEVESIDNAISASLFTLLPLRIASGTRTRILESAAMGRTVVTSAIGAEGLDFSEHEIAFAQTPSEFADQIKKLIEHPEITSEMAVKIKKRAAELYSEKSVAEFLVKTINEPAIGKTKVLLVLNRFYPEVGGAETNLFFQANKLAEKFDVTVFTPLRMAVRRFEHLNGYRVFRFFDFLNIGKSYPVLSQKTVCPGMFFAILFGDYDIIQCFPAVNYNNMLALIAAKIRRKPIILCSFDLLDYSGIIESEGKIDPNMLKNYKPDWKRAVFFPKFDHIYAISNREIDFYKQFNPSVEYSPVPVLIEEYKKEVENPRGRYGISKDNFVFLSLGRVSKIKGQDLALDAFIKIAREIPDSLLVFVGRKDYEPSFIAEMEKKINDNGISKKVIFTGMVQRDEVLAWLKYSDIHVIPVRFMNSGAVVVETWISDTPVIQSDAVDPNLVEEGGNGYFFHSENVDQLAEKMKLAHSQKSMLPSMARSGRKLVEEKYGYDYLIDLYAGKYRELLKKGEK